MRFVTAKSLKTGMIVGRNFYNNSMCIMLRKGVVLTDSYINAIRRVNISGLYIDDIETRDIIIKPLIDEDLKLKFAAEVKNIFSSIQTMVKPETGVIESIIGTITDQISKKTDHVVSMFDLKSFDDYTFQHSIDVCLLAAVTGKAFNLSPHLLNQLALSAVYHDIGKMYVNPKIINKNGPLNEAENNEMRIHPQKGFDYMKKLGITRNDVLNGIFQHHERYDGTGYPQGLAGDDISYFAKIIALTDVFDAITSKRPYYEEAMLPSDAVEFIMALGGRHFDLELTNVFIKNISAYPVGLTIKLSNGMVGVVAENYPGYTLRPLVKVLPKKEEGSHPFFISLKSDRDAQNITITEVVR